MAEYNDIMTVAKTKVYLRENCIDSNFFTLFEKYIRDLMNFINVKFDFDIIDKAISLTVQTDINSINITIEQYKYNIVLAFMQILNDHVIINRKTPVEIATKLAFSRQSAPHAMSLFDITFLCAEESTIIKISF